MKEEKRTAAAIAAEGITSGLSIPRITMWILAIHNAATPSSSAAACLLAAENRARPAPGPTGGPSLRSAAPPRGTIRVTAQTRPAAPAAEATLRATCASAPQAPTAFRCRATGPRSTAPASPSRRPRGPWPGPVRRLRLGSGPQTGRGPRRPRRQGRQQTEAGRAPIPSDPTRGGRRRHPAPPRRRRRTAAAAAAAPTQTRSTATGRTGDCGAGGWPGGGGLGGRAAGGENLCHKEAWARDLTARRRPSPPRAVLASCG